MSLKKNVALNLLLQALNLATPLFVLPHLARALEPTSMGTVSFFSAILQYFTFISLFGANIYGVRSIAILDKDPIQISRVISSILTVQFALGIISITALSLFGTLNQTIIGNDFGLFAALLITFTSCWLDTSWASIGLQNLSTLVKLNLIGKAIYIGCIFSFVDSQEHVFRYFLIFGISNLAVNISQLVILLNKFNNIRIDFSNFKKSLSEMFPVFLPQALIVLYSNLDKIVLGLSNSKTELGHYDISQRTVSAVIGIITSVSPLMLSYATSSRQTPDNFRLALLINLYFGLPLATSLFKSSSWLLPAVFGQQYQQSAALTQILTAAIPLVVAGNAVIYLIVLPNKRDRQFLKFTVFQAAILAVAYLTLGSHFGATGIAVSFTVSHFLTLSLIILSLENSEKREIWLCKSEIIRMTVAAGTVPFVLAQTNFVFFPSIERFLLEALCSVLIYIFALFTLKSKTNAYMFGILKQAILKLSERRFFFKA
jgi:O-antigen/teichoic acid export membrane protein